MPPRQAPRDRAHHRGSTSMPPCCMVWIMGMRVATKGMLSRKAEMRAEAHKTNTMASTSLSPTSSSMPLASMAMTPVLFRPPTTTNRPMKNKMVDHSTPRITSSAS